MRGCTKAYVWRADIASAKANNDIDVERLNGGARSEYLVEENERDAQQSERDPRQLTDQASLAHDANAQSDGQQRFDLAHGLGVGHDRD